MSKFVDVRTAMVGRTLSMSMTHAYTSTCTPQEQDARQAAEEEAMLAHRMLRQFEADRVAQVALCFQLDACS